jgi:cellulose synthase/poly-beta-1,6-N-acetylglucosamine synthase-like glycosyltransferase
MLRILVLTAWAALLAGQCWFPLLLLIDRWLRRRPLEPLPRASDWPPVSVQLAVYREHRVVRELIETIVAIEYPHDALRIDVLDDSTGIDAELTEAVVRERAAAGDPVRYVNRGSRAGFKAGALNHGLTLVPGELVAYFDADCRPRPNFLRNTVPFFADPGVAAVVGRWDFSNDDHSALTLLQASTFGWMFKYEQPVRNKLGLPAQFMGSAAVWRKSAMEAVGGWQEVPFTAEDLDMTYRVATAGWRVIYQPSLVAVTTAVEGRLAFRAQQRRWGRSQAQVVSDHRGYLARLSWSGAALVLSILLAWEAGLFLLPAVLLCDLAIFAGVERTPAWIAVHVLVSASVLGAFLLTTLLPAPSTSRHPWLTRISRIAGLLVETLGASVSYAFGVVDFVRGTPAEFVTTPKGGVTATMRGSAARWLANHLGPMVMEGLLAVLTLSAASIAVTRYPETVVPLVTFGAGLLASCAQTSAAAWAHLARLRAELHPGA